MPVLHHKDTIKRADCGVQGGSAAHCFSAGTERRIQNFWNTLTSQQPKLYDGPLLRVQKVADTNGAISISTSSDITYRQLVGLRNIQRENGVVVSESMQALSMILVPVTTDNVCVLHERNSGDWEQSYELPGGFITPEEVLRAEGDLFAVAQQKATKELAISVNAFQSIACVGTLDQKDICEYMLVFKVYLSIDFGSYKLNHPAVQAISAKAISSAKHPLHTVSGIVMEAVEL